MKHKPVKRWEIYRMSGRRVCPRCGEGFWLAEHKDKGGRVRYYCGKCHYTEFV